MLYLKSSPEILPEEAEKLKDLAKVVNIIPILTKGDHITKDDILRYKKILIKNSEKLGVEWFNIEMVADSEIWFKLFRHLETTPGNSIRLKTVPLALHPPF